MRPPASGALACDLHEPPLLQAREELTCGYLGEPGPLTELGTGERAVPEEQFECRAVVQPA
ncbi:unnamed protein product [[Actinomadura] parvosata subsp. kistnae]|nr:unnamed protein product [Actinomadura parvosata subsp. kistnae]